MQELTTPEQDPKRDEEKPNRVKQGVRLLKAVRNKTAVWFFSRVRLLSFSQWCYFVAFVILIATVDQWQGQQGDNLTVVGAIAGLGLIREIWHLFSRIWEHILGKAILLVLYAGTANFALAISALKINQIAGIEPAPFVFTLGFTTLMMLPMWIVVATVVFLSTALVLGNLWLFTAFMLRLLRVKVSVHWEDKSFVVITMILRIILIPTLIFLLISMIDPYFKQLDVFDQPIEIYDSSDFTEEQRAALQQVEDQAARRELIDQFLKENNEEEPPARILDELIAAFIYQFETYPYSACQKAEHQRSLVIDENMLFVAEKSDTDLGFSFGVTLCVPRLVHHVYPFENEDDDQGAIDPGEPDEQEELPLPDTSEPPPEQIDNKQPQT